MKRNLIILCSIILGTVLLLVAGNTITIGEKLAHVTTLWWVEYLFYLVILGVVVWFVLLPIWRLQHAPEFPVLAVADNDEGAAEEEYKQKLFKFGKQLQQNLYYLPADQRALHRDELRQKLGDTPEGISLDDLKGVLKEEIDARLKSVNRVINEWGKTVFMITTLSQNGKLDAVTVLVVNFRMIHDVVHASGFRPTKPQLVKQYGRVLVTSLFSYYLQDSLAGMGDIVIPLTGGDAVNIVSDIDPANVDISDADFSNVFSSIRIPGIIPASLLDGFINTALTLRIGYVTRAYLKKGAKELEGKKGRQVRRQAMLDSLRGTLGIMKDTGNGVATGVANRILNYLKKKTNNVKEQARQTTNSWIERVQGVFRGKNAVN